MSYSRTLVLAFWLLGGTATWAAEDGAYSLLEQLSIRYQQLDSYHDRGTVEWLDDSAGARTGALTGVLKTVSFETWKTGSSFRFDLTIDIGPGNTARRVIWRDETGIWQYDSGLEQIRPRASLAGAVSSSLGEHGLEALPVALALAGSSAGFDDVEAASFDGRRPCDEATCDVLVATRMAGTIRSELWIDRDRSEIIQLQVTSEASILSLPRYISGREIPLPTASDQTVLRVRREVLTPAAAVAFAFTPPDRAVFAAPATAASNTTGAEIQPPTDVPTFGEEITVRLLSFRIRAIDLEVPPAQLTPENFRVTVGRTEIPVQALDWLPSAAPEAALPFEPTSRLAASDTASDTAASAVASDTGRQVIYFIQAATEADRIAGHLRIEPYVRELLDNLAPADQVAVVSFDSRLKIWRDFSLPDASLTEVVKRARLFGGQPNSRRSEQGRLAQLVDPRQARDAATAEQALGIIAGALQQLQGDRLLIWQGWGLGVYTANGVRMTPDYRPAIKALRSARTPIFVLDISTTDQHSLELGLKNVAADTGGHYFSTFRLPSQATQRLAAALNSHFVLTLDGDQVTEAARQRPRARLQIRLRGVDGEIVGPPLPLR